MVTMSRYPDDVRVRRAAMVAAEDGWDVSVVAHAGTAPPDPGIRLAAVPGGTSTSPWTRHGRTAAVLRWAALPEHRSRAERRFVKAARARIASLAAPHLVHAHDLPGLMATARTVRMTQPRLLYDSHEWWSERHTEGRPAPVRRLRQRSLEQHLARRAATLVTVSEELAAVLGRALGIDDVRIVRNTFPPEPAHEPVGTPTELIYVGRVGRGRDLETVFRSRLLRNEVLGLRVVGAGDGWFATPTWVARQDAVAPEQVGELMVRSGLALVPLDDGCANHRVALPNKLFQAVAVGVPVVAADLPAIRRVVTSHGIGTLYSPGDPDSLDAAISAAIADHETLAAAVLDAQSSLSWPVDAAVLRGVYRDAAT